MRIEKITNKIDCYQSFGLRFWFLNPLSSYRHNFFSKYQAIKKCELFFIPTSWNTVFVCARFSLVSPIMFHFRNVSYTVVSNNHQPRQHEEKYKRYKVRTIEKMMLRLHFPICEKKQQQKQNFLYIYAVNVFVGNGSSLHLPESS